MTNYFERSFMIETSLRFKPEIMLKKRWIYPFSSKTKMP